MAEEAKPPLLAWATERPRVSLDALLAAMQMFDDGVAVDFDPAQVVGDLRQKVDAIKVIIDRLEFQREWCRQQAEPFTKRAAAIANNVGRLKEYVVQTMQHADFEELPGNAYRARLQGNPPSLEITQVECTAADFDKYPNYVRQVPTRYEWDKQAIKESLVEKRKDILKEADEAGMEIEAHKQTVFTSESIPFARLSLGRQVRFYLNPPREKP